MRDPEAIRAEEEARFRARKHDGKRPYRTKAAAKRIAKLTSATFKGPPKSAYRCPFCGDWHVGAKL